MGMLWAAQEAMPRSQVPSARSGGRCDPPGGPNMGSTAWSEQPERALGPHGPVGSIGVVAPWVPREMFDCVNPGPLKLLMEGEGSGEEQEGGFAPARRCLGTDGLCAVSD